MPSLRRVVAALRAFAPCEGVQQCEAASTASTEQRLCCTAAKTRPAPQFLPLLGSTPSGERTRLASVRHTSRQGFADGNSASAVDIKAPRS